MNIQELTQLTLDTIDKRHEVGENEKTQIETLMHQTDRVGITNVYCRFLLTRPSSRSASRCFGAVEIWIDEKGEIMHTVWLSTGH